jgi:hypothetical protein
MATTPQEVWQLLGELVQAQKETDRKFQETDRKFQETDRKFQENDRILKQSKQELDHQLKQSRQEFDHQLKQSRQEFDHQLKQSKQEFDRQIKELGKQIGGLGKKFDSFTEGLALPSMETILGDRFGMEIISPSVRVSKQGQHLEIDVLAYANSNINTAYIVEVKSHAREESIEQLKELLEKFPVFFPEHQHKKLYGILAAVDLSSTMKERILKEGLYVARIHDEVFELDTPSNFRPKDWQV